MGHRLSRKLLFYIVLCSVFFTLLATAFQLYMDYRRDLAAVHESIQFIESSYLKSIAASAWDMDEKQLTLQLQGALKLQDVEYLEIIEPRTAGEVIIAAQGNPNTKKDIVREFSLKYSSAPEGTLRTGTLRVSASLEGVYQRLWKKTLIILASNAVKMFLASFCIFLIIQFLITRHITKIASYTQKLEPDKLDKELVLDRKTDKSSEPDELDELVTSFNNMRVRLNKDIEERRRAEKALRESEEKYRTLFETAKDAIFLTDETGRFVDVNQVACELLGYSKEELLKLSIKDIGNEPVGYEMFLKARDGLAKKVSFEVNHRRKDGKLLPVEITENFFTIGDQRMSLSIVRDITERKHAGEQIKTSLREKELLLREIHHRVKNNLQIISSLLDMRIMRTKEQQVIDYFEDARSKIYTMAFIHEQLYESKRFDKIDMIIHADRLIGYLSQLYKNKSYFVTPVIEGSDVFLSITQAIPCAIVLNELISNAYKHAFKDKKGTIWISLKILPDDRILIRVKDDGMGMSEEIDFEKTDSLGLKLIRGIVRDQLMGEIRINRDQGTDILIEFSQLKVTDSPSA